MSQHFKGFVCLVALVLLCLPLQARDYHFFHDTHFGFLSDQSRRQVDQLMKSRTDNLYSQMRMRCNSTWQKKVGKYSFMGKTYPCSADFTRLRHGNGFRLMDGRITRIGQFFGNNASSVSYHGAKIWLNRDFRFSIDVDPIQKTYKLHSLDHRRWAWMFERKPIHQNLSVRHMPYGKTLYTKVCSELPGLRAELETSSLEGTISKRVAIFFRLKAHFTIEASAGFAGYESAQLCGASKLQAKKIESSTSLDLGKIMNSNKPSFIIQAPKVSGFNLKGFKITKMHVRGGNLLTKIIFWIAGKFKNRLVNDVKNQLNKKIQSSLKSQIKVTNKKIKNGVLFKDIMNLLAKHPQVLLTRDVVSRVLKEASQSQNRGAVEVSLQGARRYCYEALKRGGTGLSTSAIRVICTRALKKASFSPFYRDPTYRDRGCYNYSHLLYNPQKHVHFNRNEWWRSNCAIRSRLTLRVDDKLISSIKCFQANVKKNASLQQIGSRCRNAVVNSFAKLISKAPWLLNNINTPKRLSPSFDRMLNQKSKKYLRAKGWRI